MKPFFLVFIGPAVLLTSTVFRGPALALGPLLFFGFIPLMDSFVSLDKENSAPTRLLSLLPRLFVPVHLAVLGYALHVIVTGEMSPLERAFLVFDAGLASSMAINVAHELMHRSSKHEQRLAELLMASTTYTHFCVEHVQGHHKRVGTPADPATSRLGESLYQFLPRSLWGGLVSAWGIERQRSGTGPQNRLVQYAIFQLLLLATLGAALGPLGLLAFLGQSLVAILMLETINYIEHYGLVRDEISPGRFGRVQPHHSWNSSHRLTNWFLLNLARHSDHHAYAARSYADLRHYDDVPQLPASYTAMMLLATLPPLWFRVMDGRVAKIYQPRMK